MNYFTLKSVLSINTKIICFLFKKIHLMDSELYIHQVYKFDKPPVFFTQLTKSANILEVEQKKDVPDLILKSTTPP